MSIYNWKSIDKLPESGHDVIVTDGTALAIGRCVRRIIDPRHRPEFENIDDTWEIIHPIEGMVVVPTHWEHTKSLLALIALPENGFSSVGR